MAYIVFNVLGGKKVITGPHLFACGGEYISPIEVFNSK